MIRSIGGNTRFVYDVGHPPDTVGSFEFYERVANRRVALEPACRVDQGLL